jgi:hypothetical protein
MPILTRRWNDPPGPADGFILLVTRILKEMIELAASSSGSVYP